MATREDIDALKENWLKDPCWDIEDTEGFEDHLDELMAFRLEQEKKWFEQRKERIERRSKKVVEGTGISDLELAQCLSTFDEIEKQVAHQDRYLTDEYLDHNEIVTGELAQAQVRATLLLAAQVKRIADTLENMDGRDGLAESVRIWGSGN